MINNNKFGGNADPATLQELLQQALTTGLGTFMPEGFGDLLGGYISKWLLGNTVFGQMPLTNQATNTGLMFGQLGRTFSGGGQAMEKTRKNELRRETLAASYRTLNPNATQDEVLSTVDSLMSLPLFDLAYDMMDTATGFDYSTQAAKYLGKLTENQAVNAFRNGHGTTSLRIARGVVDSFYGDGQLSEQQFIDRFGKGITKAGAAILAAHIGNEIDLTADFTGGFDAGRAEQAGDRLAAAVKSYNDAMRPLRDVFGNDIPKMIEALEQVTGKAIGTLGAQRVASLSRQLANGVLTGTVDMQRFVETDQRMRVELSQRPGLALSRYMTHDSMALASEHMMSGGAVPFFVDDAMWKKMADNMATDSAMMAIGDDFTKAFTIWQAGDSSKTVEQFEAELGDRRTIDRAMELIGVNSRYELSKAYTDENYFNNQMSGVGDRLARGQRAQNAQARLARHNRMNSDLYEALGIEDRVAGGEEIEELTKTLFEAMEQDGSLLVGSEADRAERLYSILLDKNKDAIGAMDEDLQETVRQEYRAQAAKMAIIGTTMSQDEGTQRDLADVQMIMSERRAKAMSAAVDENRAALDTLDTALIDTSKGWSQYITNGGLWTRGGLSAVFEAANDLKAKSPMFASVVEMAEAVGKTQAAEKAPAETREILSDEQQRNALTAALAAAQQSAKESGLDLFKMSEEERVTFIAGADKAAQARAAEWREALGNMSDEERILSMISSDNVTMARARQLSAGFMAVPQETERAVALIAQEQGVDLNSMSSQKYAEFVKGINPETMASAVQTVRDQALKARAVALVAKDRNIDLDKLNEQGYAKFVEGIDPETMEKATQAAEAQMTKERAVALVALSRGVDLGNMDEQKYAEFVNSIDTVTMERATQAVEEMKSMPDGDKRALMLASMDKQSRDRAIQALDTYNGLDADARIIFLASRDEEAQQKAHSMSLLIDYDAATRHEMRRMMNYATSTEGMNNRAFQDILSEYAKTSKELQAPDITEERKAELEEKRDKQAMALYTASQRGLENATFDFLGARGTDNFDTRLYDLAEMAEAVAANPEGPGIAERLRVKTFEYSMQGLATDKTRGQYAQQELAAVNVNLTEAARLYDQTEGKGNRNDFIELQEYQKAIEQERARANAVKGNEMIAVQGEKGVVNIDKETYLKYLDELESKARDAARDTRAAKEPADIGDTMNDLWDKMINFFNAPKDNIANILNVLQQKFGIEPTQVKVDDHGKEKPAKH